MNEEQQALWDRIKQQQSETQILRNQLKELQKEEKENELKKYLGKYYIDKKYNDWFFYIFVNRLKNETLYATSISFHYANETDELFNLQYESTIDFSCHYLQDMYGEESDITKCIEITKEEFENRYDEFIELSKTFKNLQS